MALPSVHRLPRGHSFGMAIKGSSVSSDMASIRYRRQGRRISRFALVVSRKVSKKSAARNILRRRASEWIRRNLSRFRYGVDAVIILNPAAAAFSRKNFYSALDRLFRDLLIKAQ